MYSALIANIRSRGYFVLTYQLPYLPVERKTHSSLLDRLLGTVDVRGDQEVLMLYTSYAGPAGAAIIWKLGPDAQSIAICCTDGDPAANPAVLDWSRFSRDLIVASHFSHLSLACMTSKAASPRLPASFEDDELEPVRHYPGGCNTGGRSAPAHAQFGPVDQLAPSVSRCLLLLAVALIAWRRRIRKIKRSASA